MAHKIINTIAAHACIDPNNGHAFDASLLVEYRPRLSVRHTPNSNDHRGWAAITKADRLVLINWAVEIVCVRLTGGKAPKQPKVNSGSVTAQYTYAERVWEKGLHLKDTRTKAGQALADTLKADWVNLRGLLEPHVDGDKEPNRSSENSNKAVLFVLIGWAERYEGNETVSGNHGYLKNHPQDSTESRAFKKRDDGYYHCGAGRGKIDEPSFDVVFVARHEKTKSYKTVCVYRNVEQEDGYWLTVKTKFAKFYSVDERPRLEEWPSGQNVRRWAKRIRSRGREYESLYKAYLRLETNRNDPQIEDNGDPELKAFEGEKRRTFINHRKREWKLREEKVRRASQKGGLQCEVPGCGFDFFLTYGEIGRDFAIVHHLKPLAARDEGEETRLEDLAIVCANCHAMVHRGGESRALDSLLAQSPSSSGS